MNRTLVRGIMLHNNMDIKGMNIRKIFNLKDSNSLKLICGPAGFEPAQINSIAELKKVAQLSFH